jgi:hypothetical protein
MGVYLRIIVLIAMGTLLGGCVQSQQHRWNTQMYTAPGMSWEEILRCSGTPDVKMRLSEFVMCVDNSPRQYTYETSLEKHRFSSYREYVKFMLWDNANPQRVSDFAKGKPVLQYNPNYVNEEPYRSWTLWVYDESKRYESPEFVRWNCYVAAFNGDSLDRWIYMGEDWEPDKIHLLTDSQRAGEKEHRK